MLDSTLDFDLRLPPLPRTVAEVGRLQSRADGEPDVPALVRAISLDPIVGAEILRRINSAYYGLRRRVGGIPLAVRLLGFDEVCNIALTQSLMKLRDVLPDPGHAALSERILRAGVGAGYLAREMAGLLRLPLVRNPYTIGLLHNIGRLVLLFHHGAPYAHLWDPGALPPALKRERALLDYDSAAVGARALETWLLPQAICDAVAYWDRYEEVDEDARHLQQSAAVLAVASYASEGLCERDAIRAHPALHDAVVRLADVVASETPAILEWLDTVAPTARAYVDATS